MALPLAPNNTCDIYRSGNAPPASPAVAAVPCYFQGRYARGLEAGEGDSDALKFTHLMLVDLAADVRDAYGLGMIGATFDAVYVPDQNGVKYNVVFVERRNRGLPGDHQRVYLARNAPGWP